MRVLIIEDDEDVSRLLKNSLEAEAFSVDVAHDGEKGSYMARINGYDIVILDFVLPKKDGKTICQEIRKAGKKMPIIMLTVRSAVDIKVDMLNTGVDDYLTKPFSFHELLARMRALLRRPTALEQSVITIGKLSLDSLKQRVTIAGETIYLTRKEFALLEYLMRNKGIVVSRGMILEHVWDAEGDPFSNTIEAHILNLRRKIEKPLKKKLIKTIPGRGYIIDTARKRVS